MSTKSVTRLSSIPDSREWKSFFIDAGIPSAESATYALTFAQNRIQSDMLVNINKDYLQEMGIKLIGDIIAILRHSRRVHDELQRRTIMKGSASTPNQSVVPQSKVVSQTAIVQGKKVSETKAVTKIEKYSDSEEEDEDEDGEEEEEEDDYTDDDEEDEVEVRNKVEVQPAPAKKKPPSIISKAVNKPAQVVSRPLQKVQRRNPSVSDRPTVTVRVTEKPKTLISKKTSVFTRLGDKVEKPQEKIIQQKITMRDIDSPEPQIPHSSNTATALPYVGILKNKRPAPSTSVVSKATKKISTMRADEEQKRPVKRPAITWVASDAKVKKMNVKDRLGSVSKVSEKPIQVKTLGSTTPRIPIVYSDAEVSSSKKVSFGPVQKKEFNSNPISTIKYRIGWGNS